MNVKSCREAIEKLKDKHSLVRCETCRHKDRCAEDKFDRWDKEMKRNKGVYLE